VTRARVLTAGAAVALAAVALLLGSAFRSSSAAAPPPPAGAADRFQAGFALGNTPALVASLQQELRAHPRDAHAWALLGLAYQ
jgi:cytochrome c-type biogenesis protein CcmH/NrfG